VTAAPHLSTKTTSTLLALGVGSLIALPLSGFRLAWSWGIWQRLQR